MSVGLRDTLDGDGGLGSAPVIVAAALVIAFGLWWIYFDALGRDALTSNRRAAFMWGYGHYALFAAVAAIGAGIQAQLHLAHSNHGPNPLAQAAAVAVPVAISLAAIAWLQQAANAAVDEAVWLYVGAGLALLVLPLSAIMSVVAVDVLLALAVVALVGRELFGRSSRKGGVTRARG